MMNSLILQDLLLRIKYLQNHSLIKNWKNADIEEILDIQHNQLLLRVRGERWTREGSGWTITSVMQHQLDISIFFLLPERIRNPMKGPINIQNEDNEYFRWYSISYLKPITQKNSYLILKK